MLAAEFGVVVNSSLADQIIAADINHDGVLSAAELRALKSAVAQSKPEPAIDITDNRSKTTGTTATTTSTTTITISTLSVTATVATAASSGDSGGGGGGGPEAGIVVAVVLVIGAALSVFWYRSHGGTKPFNYNDPDQAAQRPELSTRYVCWFAGRTKSLTVRVQHSSPPPRTQRHHYHHHHHRHLIQVGIGPRTC